MEISPLTFKIANLNVQSEFKSGSEETEALQLAIEIDDTKNREYKSAKFIERQQQIDGSFDYKSRFSTLF
jgi:hypothetical protein